MARKKERTVLRSVRRGAVAGLLTVLLAACSALPPAEPASSIRVTDAALDPDVYRITARWLGGMQAPDAETLLLIRAAELAQKARARFFFVVNASAPIANTHWLVEGSVVAPTQIVPIPQLRAEANPPEGALVAVIRVFRSGTAAKGYPLYDAERILRENRKGAV